ncbi:hypothetical protein Tco_1083543 [Tanacetum coccineum]
MATLNEPDPQGEGSGSGPGRQETMGVLKLRLVRREEDSMEPDNELTDNVPPTPHDLPLSRDKDLTIAQTLVKMRSKKAKEKGVWNLKRRDQGLAQIESDAELAQRLHEEELVELEKERQKQEEATNVALAEEFDKVQARIDADHELTVRLTHEEQEKADGSSKNYKIFSDMLNDFNRQDVLDLHRLIQERYNTTSPKDMTCYFGGDLKTLFEPNKEDEIWKNQQDYNLISWRLFDSCGVHVLLMNTGVAIDMMIEKTYPLTQEMLSRMIIRILEVDHERINNNVVGALMNVPIFVGTFFVVTDFAVLEDMDAYRDKGMGDVIIGKPFLREVGIKTKQFKGIITFYNGDDEVTYQVVQLHPRFKSHTNEQCNKNPTILNISKKYEKNGISHAYQKLKGFYKEVLNLGPDYI